MISHPRKTLAHSVALKGGLLPYLWTAVQGGCHRAMLWCWTLHKEIILLNWWLRKMS